MPSAARRAAGVVVDEAFQTDGATPLRIQVSDESTAGSGSTWAPVVTRVAESALAHLRIHPDSELSVVFVDDDEMARLHVEWMDLPGPTDVLSFPMDEMKPTPSGHVPIAGILGDLVLAPQFVTNQAFEHGVTPEAEMSLLTVHGILHLLGYDHAEPDDEAEMVAVQERVLAELRNAAVEAEVNQ